MVAGRAGWLWVVMASACGAPSAPAPEAPAKPSPFEVAHTTAMGVAARVAAEVDCAESVSRYVCAAKLLPGDPITPPEDLSRWMGLTVAVRRSRTIPDGALETVGLSQMTMGPDFIWVSSLRPTNSIETQILGPVLTNTSMAAKGRATRIEVPRSLVDYLELPPEDKWPLVADENGWAFQAAQAARLYHVPAVDGRPSAYVVIEDGEGGAFLSVFPEVPWGVP